MARTRFNVCFEIPRRESGLWEDSPRPRTCSQVETDHAHPSAAPRRRRGRLEVHRSRGAVPARLRAPVDRALDPARAIRLLFGPVLRNRKVSRPSRGGPAPAETKQIRAGLSRYRRSSRRSTNARLRWHRRAYEGRCRPTGVVLDCCPRPCAQRRGRLAESAVEAAGVRHLPGTFCRGRMAAGARRHASSRDIAGSRCIGRSAWKARGARDGFDVECCCRRCVATVDSTRKRCPDPSREDHPRHPTEITAQRPRQHRRR